ncbi:MAG: hypothetical protein SV775_15210, partial [Thermodesulfobacteriota bacterium]|nr:hypothetical protein [Thermodesulfobacteriota bacterium]
VIACSQVLESLIQQAFTRPAYKPHTGTKTSVLFFQKYTKEALAKIEEVKQAVAAACPDYEQQIKDLIAKHQYLSDLPDEKIPEEIADLIAESFAEPEPEPPDTEIGERDYEMEEPEQLMAAEGNPTLEERISESEEKRDSLKAELYPTDIDRFVVPLLDPKKQASIGDLARNSLKKLQEFKQLLEQAKSRVEQLIEEAATR